MYGPDSNIEDCLACDLTSGRRPLPGGLPVVARGRNACAHPLRRAAGEQGADGPVRRLRSSAAAGDVQEGGVTSRGPGGGLRQARPGAIRSLDGKFRLDECTIAVVPSTLHHAGRASLSSPNIGSGEAADIGASRRPSQLKRPFLARTPARPDWANLDRKPPAETRAVFVVLSAVATPAAH